jgi:uncharacterized protein (UPF0332 family)
VSREVEVLLQKARDSLQAAELLSREGYAEFAASRGYYAMLYAAQALLLTRGLSFSSHSAVIAAFGKEFAKPGRLDPKLHRYLLDAQDTRNVGDYGIDRSVSAAQAREALTWAREFLAAANQLLSAPGL